MSRFVLLAIVLLGVAVSACVPLLGDFEMSAGAGGGAAGSGGVAPGEFALNVPSAVDVAVGNSVTVPVGVVAGSGFSAEVVITVVGLPPGVTAEPLTIEGGQSGNLVLHAANEAVLGQTTPTEVTGIAGNVSHTAPLAITVVGAPGSIDVSYGTNGTAVDSLSTFFHADGARVLPDGSVLVAGDYSSGSAFVARYTATGEVDSTYGTDGKAEIIPSGGSSWLGFSAADDGSVFLAVSTFLNPGYQLAFIKLRPDGQLDGAFGLNGMYVEATTMSDSTTLGPVFALADGRFLAFLTSLDSGSVQRRAAAGDADASWTGSNTFPSGFAPHRLGVDPSLNPIAVCPQLSVARLTPNGDPDSGFGAFDVASGMYFAATDFGIGASGTFEAFVSHQNRIYSVATVAPPDPSPTGMGIAAFDAQGTPGVEFGNGGTTELLFGSANADVTTGDDLIVDQDTFLVALGTSIEGGVGTFLLARYGLDGQLDPTFGNGGLATHAAASWGAALALGHQPDGRLLMVGATSTDIVIARYWP